jgi:hypothetical protein
MAGRWGSLELSLRLLCEPGLRRNSAGRKRRGQGVHLGPYPSSRGSGKAGRRRWGMAARGAQWQRDGSKEEVSWWTKWMRGGVTKGLALFYSLGMGRWADDRRNCTGNGVCWNCLNSSVLGGKTKGNSSIEWGEEERTSRQSGSLLQRRPGAYGAAARGGGAARSILHLLLFVAADWRKKKGTLGWAKNNSCKNEEKQSGLQGLFERNQRDQQERNRNHLFFLNFWATEIDLIQKENLNFKSMFWTFPKIEIWTLIQRFNLNKFELIALESFQKYKLLDLEPRDFNFKPKDLNSKGDFETRFLKCKERVKWFWEK